MPPTPHQAWRSVEGSTLESAPRGQNVPSPTSAGSQAVVGITLPRCIGMYWRGQYYIDTCLPFGLRSAPSIFNNFATAIHWTLENNDGDTLFHYLDDFLLVGPPEQPICQEAMATMLQVCERMGVPVTTEKCEGPATCITFLGTALDSCSSSDCQQTSFRKFHP